jgi:hypothetical protein
VLEGAVLIGEVERLLAERADWVYLLQHVVAAERRRRR